MATHQEILDHVKEKYGFKPRTCWIAHVSESKTRKSIEITFYLGEHP